MAARSERLTYQVTGVLVHRRISFVLLDKAVGSSHSPRQMPRRFRSAYSGGWLALSCLLASCMRFGYEPADELDDSVGLDGGRGGTLSNGGSAGSFAGADGSSDSARDTSIASGGAGGTTTNASAASTDAAGGSSGSGGMTSTDSGGATNTTTATSTDSSGTTNTDGGGTTSTDSDGTTSTDSGGTTSTDGANTGGAGTGGSGGTGTGGTGSGGSGGTGTGGTSTGGAGGTGTGGTGTGGSGGTGTGGSGGTGTGGATSSATTGGGGACTPTGTADYLASFDADLEGFALTGSGGPTLTWNGTVGSPDLGALELNASSGGAMQVRNLTPPGDLTGRIMSVNVYVEAGTGVDVILYVQSGSPAKWADGGTITATVGQWYCLTLDLDNPVTTSASFDPTDVRVVGVDIQGSGDVQVYIDQFAY